MKSMATGFDLRSFTFFADAVERQGLRRFIEESPGHESNGADHRFCLRGSIGHTGANIGMAIGRSIEAETGMGLETRELRP